MSPHHVHYVQSLEPLQGGGLGVAAHALHCAMRAQGERSTLLSTRGRQTIPNKDAEEFLRCGPERAFFAPGLGRRGRELARESGAVFHSHGFYVYPQAVCGHHARANRRPMVIHPHGMLEPWILRRSKLRKRVAGWLFERANWKAARLWRALTQVEADQIRAQGIRAQVIVVPNGIDPLDFQPFRNDPRERTILFLGRLHPKKGIDLLLRAWSSWGPHFPEWRLVLAGPDEGGYAATIRETLRREQIARVELPGTVSGAAKLRLLSSAGVFALTSYSEGFPMAVLEAMAAGCPVVVTRECRIPQVERAEAGWVAEAEEQAVHRALGQALHASDLERHQRGQAGIDLVAREFSWPRLCGQISEACVNL